MPQNNNAAALPKGSPLWRLSKKFQFAADKLIPDSFVFCLILTFVVFIAALIGTILRIKPVLQIQGEKLDAFKKVHTLKQAKETITNALRHDLNTRFKEYAARGEIALMVAHTANDAEAEIFLKELQEAFPNLPCTFCDPLSLSVSCHIGPGALAAACARIL